MINDFYNCLAFSTDPEHESFWEQVYSTVFPDMLYHINVYRYCQGQELGIDRIIYLKSGKVLFVDEKLRAKDYEDIALEYISNDQTDSLGWIEKDLLIDYLAYAFWPSKRCYIFDWQFLQRNTA